MTGLVDLNAVRQQQGAEKQVTKKQLFDTWKVMSIVRDNVTETQM